MASAEPHREPLKPGAILADCLSRTKTDKPEDVWLKKFEIEPISNPFTARVVLLTSEEVRPGNSEITLRNISKAVEPAIQIHQQYTSGGKLRVELRTPNSPLDLITVPGERLLTRREFKKLEVELKSALSKIGIGNFVVTMYSISLNGIWNNLIGVHGDFNYSHIPYLRKIHDLYKPRHGSKAYEKIISDGGFFADIKFTVKQESSESKVGRLRGTLLTGTRSQLAIHQQMNHFLAANEGQVYDWRCLRMASLDDKPTKWPEDLSYVRPNSDGTMTVFTAAPFTLYNPMTGTSTKFFEEGVDTLAIGIITTLSPEKRASVGRAGLVVVREKEKISWQKANLILSGDFEAAEASREEIDTIQKLHVATQLSASRSIILGATVKNVFQDEHSAVGLDIHASDMVTELMVSNQRALATFLCAQGIPVLVKRSKPSYAALFKDFKNLFGDSAHVFYSYLGTSKEPKLFEILKNASRSDLIREIASCKIMAQRSASPDYAAISERSKLRELDKAPFKPKHGSIASTINQLQLAAYSTGCEPFTIDELKEIALKLNSQSNAGQEIIESQTVRNKKIMISEALFSSVENVVWQGTTDRAA